MYQGPSQPSYRLGDHARKTLADGGYIVRVTNVEPSTTRDGDPQLKISSVVLGGQLSGQPHTWWYPCKETMLFILFNDLIAAGFDDKYDMGPPDANRWSQVVGSGLVNRAFQVEVSTRKDFSNTKIRGPVQLDPAGNPMGFAAAGPLEPQRAFPGPVGVATAPNGPAHGMPATNVPEVAQPGGFVPQMTFGNQPPQNVGAPQPVPQPQYVPPQAPYPTAAPPPTGYSNVQGPAIDPASLFRTQ